MKTYILYNPIAASGRCIKKAEKLASLNGSCSEIVNIISINDFSTFFSTVGKDDKVIICGGDGTLNRFINSISEINIQQEIFYYPAGTGNDFYNDIGETDANGCIKLNEYIENLPVVYTDGKKQLFINGIGYGVDGYCCEETNRLKQLKKKASYPLIALKGLLYAYKPTNAIVTVDGETFRYNKVWLASSMLGKFFGGGIKIAPTQNRNDSKGMISLIIAYGLGKLDIIRLFPSIFKGNHIKQKKFIAVHQGYDISVEFDRPTAMQVDGETGDKVSKYRVVKREAVNIC